MAQVTPFAQQVLSPEELLKIQSIYSVWGQQNKQTLAAKYYSDGLASGATTAITLTPNHKSKLKYIHFYANDANEVSFRLTVDTIPFTSTITSMFPLASVNEGGTYFIPYRLLGTPSASINYTSDLISVAITYGTGVANFVTCDMKIDTIFQNQAIVDVYNADTSYNPEVSVSVLYETGVE